MYIYRDEKQLLEINTANVVGKRARTACNCLYALATHIVISKNNLKRTLT